MKEILCNECGQHVPYHKTSSYKDDTYCNICITKIQHKIPHYPFSAKRNYDPSVCHYCGAEANKTNHKTFHGLPTCGTCQKRYVSKKTAIPVLLLFIIIFGLFMNDLPRNINISATTDLVKRADTALHASNIEKAISLSAEAIAKDTELKIAYFINEIAPVYQLLEKNDYANAAVLLEKLEDKYPNESDIGTLSYIANGLLAFEAKDYEEMYENLRWAKYRLRNNYGYLLLAQAAACMYVETEITIYYQEAEDLIDNVSRPDVPKNIDRIQHIQYILDSKQIISADVFKQQFPKGYTGDAE